MIKKLSDRFSFYESITIPLFLLLFLFFKDPVFFLGPTHSIPLNFFNEIVCNFL